MDIILLIKDFLIDPYSQWAFFIASLLLMIGYTWAAKVDDTTTVQAAHVNLLQTEKLDRDGEIPATGTIQWDKGADVASAAALPVLADGNYFDITGTTAITSINKTQSQPGTSIKLHFDAILLIVHDGDNIILPDGKDIWTMAGTELEFTEYSAGKWRCTGYLRGVPVLTNLLSNSGFGYWPQSDASKGLATITYDAGNKQAGTSPSVGDAVVGGTSGATAKLISYTIATGTFATGDATGVFTVGAVSHDFAFIDNETITFDGVETAVINMPSSAVGVGLVQNGGFAADEDPPNGWTASGSTLTTEGAGQVGNCLMIANSAEAIGLAYQDVTCVIGKIYKFTVYGKKGTGDAFSMRVGSVADSDKYYDSGTQTDAAWTKYTGTFEALDTTVRINLYNRDTNIGDTVYFDEVTLYEITPCSTSGAAAMDRWIKDTTGDVYRQHNDGGTYTHDGMFYSLKFVPGATGDWVAFPGATARDLEEWYRQFAGQIVTFGMWLKTSTASHCRFSVEDGVATTFSAYHSGGGGWEFIKHTHTFPTNITRAFFLIKADVAPAVNGDTIIYASCDMLVYGSNLGEGDYQPKQDDFIWGAAPITSNKYDSYTDLDDFTEDINIEADSDAMIPKGAKAIAVLTSVLDSGSAAAADVHLQLRKDATSDFFYVNSVSGRTNDMHSHKSGIQPCDVNGDVDIHIDSSGADTLDIEQFEYHGVKVS